VAVAPHFCAGSGRSVAETGTGKHEVDVGERNDVVLSYEQGFGVVLAQRLTSVYEGPHMGLAPDGGSDGYESCATPPVLVASASTPCARRQTSTARASQKNPGLAVRVVRRRPGR